MLCIGVWTDKNKDSVKNPTITPPSQVSPPSSYQVRAEVANKPPCTDNTKFSD